MKAVDNLVSPASVCVDNLVNLSRETKLPVEGVAGVLTSLVLVLLGSARDQLEHTTLLYELMQLGTPKEHAGTIARLYRERRGELIMATRKESLRLSSMARIGWRVEAQGRGKEWELGLDKVVRLEVKIMGAGKKEEQR